MGLAWYDVGRDVGGGRAAFAALGVEGWDRKMHFLIFR